MSRLIYAPFGSFPFPWPIGEENKYQMSTNPLEFVIKGLEVSTEKFKVINSRVYSHTHVNTH